MEQLKELKDSSQLAGDWQALRRLVASEGYVFLRGLLDHEMVRSVGRTGLGHLQAAGWTSASDDPLIAAPRLPVRAVRMRDAFGDAGYQRILADPGFNRIPYATPLADVMARILGPAGFCYPLKVPRVVYPARLVANQPGGYVHMDYSSVQDMFTCWVPLQDVSPSHGGLAVEPGSQTTDKVWRRPFDRLEQGWVTTDYRAGDVLIFHCLTNHAALPNRKEQMRLSAEYRWQLADQPAPRRMVIGPHGDEIGSRLFAGTPWWRPTPPGLQLYEDNGSRAPLRPPPPSRFLTLTA